jgi:excisionase family DNA binding protein
MGLQFLTASEIAEELGVSTSTVAQWGRLGKIPRVKVSHKIIRFDREAVLSALSQAGKEQNGGQTQ